MEIINVFLKLYETIQFLVGLGTLETNKGLFENNNILLFILCG